jgi:hypothetical protein
MPSNADRFEIALTLLESWDNEGRLALTTSTSPMVQDMKNARGLMDYYGSDCWCQDKATESCPWCRVRALLRERGVEVDGG